ncbi:MAG: hypothetical protein ACYC6T_05870 [Thermoleophilia bacterium]
MERARAELAEGLPEEEIRRKTLERAKEETLAGIRVLFPGLNRKALRASAPFALRALADDFAKKWRKKKVRDGAARITEALGWDAWLAGFILDWAKTGEPGAYLAGFDGGVHTITVGPEGERFPMVVVLATPPSDPDALIEEFRAQFQQIMPRASLRSIRDPETRARWFRLFEEGQSDRQIAELELEKDGFDLRAVDDAEYKRERTLLMGRIRTARKRWLDHVTEITGSV